MRTWQSNKRGPGKRQPGSLNVELNTKKTQWQEPTKLWWSHLEERIGAKRLASAQQGVKKGLIRAMSIEPGIVKAVVQTQDRTTVDVELPWARQSEQHDKAFLRKLTQTLMTQPELVAGLRQHRLSTDILDWFDDYGLSLLPELDHGVEIQCSCSESVIPCTHASVLLALLVDIIDRAPYHLLTWRGCDNLLDWLFPTTMVAGSATPPPANPDDSSNYWGRPVAPSIIHPDMGEFKDSTSPPDFVRPMEMWTGHEKFSVLMGALYRDAMPRGLELMKLESLDADD